ncbi:MAG: sodium:proton antiporter NhaD [Saprospiraceae bacterium]
MTMLLIFLFVIGYAAIVLEHPLKTDKTIAALLMGSLMWAVISCWNIPVESDFGASEGLEPVLLHHIGKIAEILFFLIGAMTIVELIDLHMGFSLIADKIRTRKKINLLWIIVFMSFFLSAVLDNLACTIVLITLLRKLVPNAKDRIWYSCFVILGANAGGAWSPIGDVTTTMLWIAGKVSAMSLIEHIFIPALVSVIVPLCIAIKMPVFQGNLEIHSIAESDKAQDRLLSSRSMLVIGLLSLLSVPVFKTITHLPPYMGMMMALGIVWLASEFIHPEEDFDSKNKYSFSVQFALSRIEFSSVLFFLGILLSIAALESSGILMDMSNGLDNVIQSRSIVIMSLGFASAIVDNVPIVAAVIGMYKLPIDNAIWHFIAYTAGTGGSMLIIGSAAGVAAMGMEKISFIWYLRKISWIFLISYLSGCATFLLLKTVI